MKEVHREQLYLMGQGMKAVGFNINMQDAINTVRFLRREYASVSKAVGYESIVNEKPHIAKIHVLKKNPSLFSYIRQS